MTTVRVLTQRAARAAYWTVETLALIVWALLIFLFGFALGVLVCLVR